MMQYNTDCEKGRRYDMAELCVHVYVWMVEESNSKAGFSERLWSTGHREKCCGHS